MYICYILKKLNAFTSHTTLSRLSLMVIFIKLHPFQFIISSKNKVIKCWHFINLTCPRMNLSTVFSLCLSPNRRIQQRPSVGSRVFECYQTVYNNNKVLPPFCFKGWFNVSVGHNLSFALPTVNKNAERKN